MDMILIPAAVLVIVFGFAVWRDFRFGRLTRRNGGIVGNDWSRWTHWGHAFEDRRLRRRR